MRSAERNLFRPPDSPTASLKVNFANFANNPDPIEGHLAHEIEMTNSVDRTNDSARIQENRGNSMSILTKLQRTFATFMLVTCLTMSICFAQSGNLLINGDFEDNSASMSLVDTSNAIFNFRMDDVKAYGPRDGIDILTFGTNMLDHPQSGNWNLALQSDAGGHSEEISFPLTAQMQMNEKYCIEFFLKRLISLTHSGGTIEFGVSNDPNSFGWKVAESDEAVSVLWQPLQVTFTAPTNMNYLTVRVANSDNHYVGLDNFTLRHMQGNLLMNGDFEDNAIDTGNLFAITNEDFNDYMPNVTAFGADSGLDIIPIGDDSGDNVMEDPISGFWKIGGGLNTFDGVPEAFSFSLSAPVLAGQLYYLEYHIEKMLTFGEIDDGTGASLSFGLSNLDNSVGFHISQSPQAELGWTRHAATFFAPINANYLTVTIIHTGNQWIGMDDFSLRQFLLGDLNFDGVVNLLDVGPFVDALSSPEHLAEADVNGDGAVDLLDVAPFIDLLTG